MEIEERATGKVFEADLEALVEAEINRRGYNIISGLKNSALVGIKLELELIRVKPVGGKTRGGARKQPKTEGEVANPDGRPL